MQARAAQFDIDVDRDILKLVARGDWRARHLGPIDAGLRDFEDDSVGREIVIDVSGIEKLDTAGAMVLHRVLKSWNQRSAASRIVGASPDHAFLLDRVGSHMASGPVAPASRNAFVLMLDRLGQGWRTPISPHSKS